MNKNWLTTVVGILSGTLMALIDALQSGTLQFTWKSAGFFVAFTALGLVTKAFNITGIGDKATSDPAKDATKPTNLAGQ